MPDRLIRITTTVVVLGVAIVAAIVSYEHAYALVRAHGEARWTARLVPLTVDGLIYSSSMVMLNSAKRRVSVPPLALWLLALGILATLAANVMHGLGHGPIGAAVAAWPAAALVGSYELLMTLIRSSPGHEPDGQCVSERVSAADPLQVQAADTFAAQVANGTVPSIRAIRSALCVGQPRAQQIQAYLADIVRT
jgi:Protein of unknown function (DUF2637)